LCDRGGISYGKKMPPLSSKVTAVVAWTLVALSGYRSGQLGKNVRWRLAMFGVLHRVQKRDEAIEALTANNSVFDV